MTVMNDLSRHSLSLGLMSMLPADYTNIIETTGGETPISYKIPEGARHIEITSTVPFYYRISKNNGSDAPTIIASLDLVSDGTGSILKGTAEVRQLNQSDVYLSIATIGEAGKIAISTYK